MYDWVRNTCLTSKMFTASFQFRGGRGRPTRCTAYWKLEKSCSFWLSNNTLTRELFFIKNIACSYTRCLFATTNKAKCFRQVINFIQFSTDDMFMAFSNVVCVSEVRQFVKFPLEKWRKWNQEHSKCVSLLTLIFHFISWKSW